MGTDALSLCISVQGCQAGHAMLATRTVRLRSVLQDLPDHHVIIFFFLVTITPPLLCVYHGLTNRKIGEAKKVTKFELNPANLSGFWREI